jgi:hypothetical protein
MTLPNRTQLAGLLIVLGVLIVLAFVRACAATSF